MSISILNRGASGGLKPELTVIAPSGSTIDLLQNGSVVKTYTLGADETEYTFVVKVGTYTVRGTLGDKAKSVDAVIDTVGQYEVTIDYKLWLYREGDECEDVTGGWGTDGWTTSESGWAISTSVTKNTDNMYTKAPATNRYCVGAMTNPVDLTGYNKLCMDVYTGSAAWALELLVTGSKDYNGANGFLYEDKSAATRSVVMADISSINQEAYIAFASGGNNTGRWAYIYNIWLE